LVHVAVAAPEVAVQTGRRLGWAHERAHAREESGEALLHRVAREPSLGRSPELRLEAPAHVEGRPVRLPRVVLRQAPDEVVLAPAEALRAVAVERCEPATEPLVETGRAAAGLDELEREERAAHGEHLGHAER